MRPPVARFEAPEQIEAGVRVTARVQHVQSTAEIERRAGAPELEVRVETDERSDVHQVIVERRIELDRPRPRHVELRADEPVVAVEVVAAVHAEVRPLRGYAGNARRAEQQYESRQNASHRPVLRLKCASSTRGPATALAASTTRPVGR